MSESTKNVLLGVFAVGIILVLVVVGIYIIQITGESSNGEVATTTEEEIVEETEDEEIPDEEEQEEDIQEDEEEEVVVPDLSNFSTNDQTVGSAISGGTRVFDLKTISNSSQSGYHRFVFPIESSKVSTTPLVTAKYISEQGIIRVTLNSLLTDNSGILFQHETTINKDGVLKIYHSISGQDGLALYDIGISKSTTFLLSSRNLGGNKWEVYLDVKYPGANNSSGGIDLGSTTFSTSKQTITGGTSADGAGLQGYEYNAASGVYTFTLKVAGSSEKPLPSCSAEYVGGSLVLTFNDVGYSYLNNGYTAGVGSGGTMYVTQSGNQYKLRFDGINNQDFKLSGSTNPNVIMIEVKL